MTKIIIIIIFNEHCQNILNSLDISFYLIDQRWAYKRESWNGIVYCPVQKSVREVERLQHQEIGSGCWIIGGWKNTPKRNASALSKSKTYPELGLSEQPWERSWFNHYQSCSLHLILSHLLQEKTWPGGESRRLYSFLKCQELLISGYGMSVWLLGDFL